MGIWKDKERGHWRYQFQYRGRICAGRGFDTRREATAEREKRREEVKAEFSKQTQLGTVLFSELSSKYLDFSERKHAKATYKYKVITFNRFLKYHGNIPAESITPAHVLEFLNSLPTNRVYNAARKEISALFEYAIHKLSMEIKNPCSKIDIMLI